MYELRAKSGGLRFALNLDSDLAGYVTTDSGKLRQILSNLMSNALKFTDEGDICLRARSTPMPDDPAMCRLELEVADSGCGIPPELLEGIFEPFVQDKRAQTGSKGTGLGLAISRSFVEMMDGEISVDSTPGKGSVFRVELPVALSEASEGVDVGSFGLAVLGLAPGQPVWRILVVEDIVESRLLLSSLLREAGFEVREAENGEEAISLFQQWQPHLIWMDMRMPVMDGYEATRRIRNLAAGGAVKIIAVTASAFTEQRPQILAAGCDEVIHKPFRNHEVFESMARLLDIEYLYEKGGQELIRKVGNNLTADMLADLPGELVQELRETTLVLNQEAILEVIGRIEAHAPDTAAGLRELVDNYQVVELRELLGKVG